MSGVITPVALILISIGIFVGYIQPSYSGVSTSEDRSSRSILQLQEDLRVQNEAVVTANELIGERDRLEGLRSNIDGEQVKKLDKLLPSNMDGVRLAYDLDTLANDNGMAISDLNIGAEIESASANGAIASGEEAAYGQLAISFSAKGDYEKIKSFIETIENSLRVADITSMEMGEADDAGDHTMQISMNIYWLKQQHADTE
jgi:Tfp pilus assembly protein PilO